MKNFLTLALLAGGFAGVLGGISANREAEIEVRPAAVAAPALATPAPPRQRPDAGRSDGDEDFVGADARHSLNQVRSLSVDRLAVLRH